jgi:hypothetical protein
LNSGVINEDARSEAHIAQLGLQPIFIEPDKVVAPPALPETREHPVQALEQVYESLIPERFQFIGSGERCGILRLEFQSGSL